MRYILDFDRTLFSTERFISAAALDVQDSSRLTASIWDTYDASSFLYEDTIPFLESLSPEKVVILTAWSERFGPQVYDFQTAKVERSGVTKYVSEVELVSGDKGPHIRKLLTSEPTVFVDDKIAQLLSAKEHCPEVTVVQMIRPSVSGLPTHPSVPIITSLKELHNFTIS
jgi:hypothetical protein